MVIYLPESFEWIVLKSGLVREAEEILQSPAEHIESSDFYTWERFFTRLLVDYTKDSYLRYNKKQLNKNYLNERIMNKISEVIPEIREN